MLPCRLIDRTKRRPARRAKPRKTRTLRSLGVIVPMPHPATDSRSTALKAPHFSETRDVRFGVSEQEWLRNHWAEHVGRWVAIEGGRLLAEADTAREALESARASGYRSPFLIHVTAPDELPFGGW